MVVCHQNDFSSGWSLVGLVFHQVNLSWDGLFSEKPLVRAVSHQGWSLIREVSHQGCLSSGWSLIRGGYSSGRSLIRVVSHQGWLLIREVSYQGGLSSGVVTHQGGLSSGWSLIRGGYSSGRSVTRVVSHQGWLLIREVSHQGGLSSGVVTHQGGLSSGVVTHQGGLSSGVSLIGVVSHKGIYHPCVCRQTRYTWSPRGLKGGQDVCGPEMGQTPQRWWQQDHRYPVVFVHAFSLALWTSACATCGSLCLECWWWGAALCAYPHVIVYTVGSCKVHVFFLLFFFLRCVTAS